MAKSKNKTNSTSTATKAANSMAKKSKDSGKKKGGIIAFLKSVKQELKKVVWPTKEELGTDTVVVIVTCAFFALAFWLIDTGFLAALQGILGITLS